METLHLNIKKDKDGKLAPIFPTYDCTTDFDDESSYPVMERDEDGEYYWRNEVDRRVIQQQIALFRARAKTARHKMQMFSILYKHQKILYKHQNTPACNIEGFPYQMRQMNLLHSANTWVNIWFSVHSRCAEYATKLERYLDLIKE